MQRQNASMQREMQAALQREEAVEEEVRQVEAEMTAKAAYRDWCAQHANPCAPAHCAANAQDVEVCAREEKKADYNDIREHMSRQ